MCIFPTDFLRTHFQPTSKSPQKFIPTSLLPENQWGCFWNIGEDIEVFEVFKLSISSIPSPNI